MQLCSLIRGRIGEFDGLRPFALGEPPGCLGSEVRRGWLLFSGGHLEYRILARPSDPAETWLFASDDAVVCLVEIFHLPADATPSQLMDTLGGPGDEIEIPVAARLQRPIVDPDELAAEHVYATRGLALAVAWVEGRAARVARLRAFPATTLEAYVDAFVHLRPPRFEPP